MKSATPPGKTCRIVGSGSRGVQRDLHPFFFLSRRGGAVILSERAERARAKDLLEDAWRMQGRPASEGPAVPARRPPRQVLRACGAQDDSARSLGRMEYKMRRGEV